MLVTLVANDPAKTSLVIHAEDGTDTGFRLLSGANWGNAVWEQRFSGARGTQGAAAASGTPQNRPVVLPLRVYGTSKDHLLRRIGYLNTMADLLRRFGGTIIVRLNNATYKSHFTVLTGASAVQEWSSGSEANNRTLVTFEAVCAPYVNGEPMGFTDTFDGGSIDLQGNTVNGDLSRYTFDAGSGTVTVSGGVLVPSTTATKRMRVTAYDYTDVQATYKFSTYVGFTGTDMRVGVRADKAGADTYLGVMVDGTNMRLVKREAGADTTLVTNGQTLNNGSNYWLRCRIEGNVLYGELFADDEPTPTKTPTRTQTYTLSSAEQAAFPSGHVTFVLRPADTNWRFDDFSVEPYSYRSQNTPDEFTITGVPGDVPALCDVSVSIPASHVDQAFGLLGWGDVPAAWNMVMNGTFDTNANGWATSDGGTYIATGASISLTFSSAKFGKGKLQVASLSGTANTGCQYTVYRRFKKGVPYTLSLWHYMTGSGTTTWDVRIGAKGSTTGALTTTMTANAAFGLSTFTWTPTSDCDAAQISFRQTGTLGGSLWMDGVTFYEGASAPTLVTQSEGRGAYPPVGIVLAADSDHANDDNTYWDITSTAGTRSGYILSTSTASSSATYVRHYLIDPSLGVPDDYRQGEIDVEVWGRVWLDSALASATVVLSNYISANNNRYTHEFGSQGVTVVNKSSSGARWRMCRLGTLTFLINRSAPERQRLKVSATVGVGSSGSFGLDYLLLVPARGRALSPSGKTLDSGYPTFVVDVGSVGATKVIASDLAGYSKPNGSNLLPTHGLGGSLIEVPQGSSRFVVKLSNLVPDDPTAVSTQEGGGTTPATNTVATVQFSPTPRFGFMRV